MKSMNWFQNLSCIFYSMLLFNGAINFWAHYCAAFVTTTNHNCADATSLNQALAQIETPPMTDNNRKHYLNTSRNSSQRENVTPKRQQFLEPATPPTNLPTLSLEAAIVNVSLHIETMRNIANEVTLDFYLIQKWKDSRIYRKLKQQDESHIKSNNNNNNNSWALYDGLNFSSVLISGRERPGFIWYPDTYFLLVHSLLYSPEEQSVEVMVMTDGTKDVFVEYIRKVRLVTPCTPNVLLFPFDIVNCTLTLSSFANTVNNLRYQWDVERSPNGVFVDVDNNDADHLGFQTLPTEHIDYHCIYGPNHFSCLKAIVSLKRNFSAYVLQIYIPATLLVVLSWITFWVNIHSTPARASLSVTTVLTILTLATTSATQNEKHVSGKVTALDIYVWICFGFVILAMIEFSLSDFVATSAANSSSGKIKTKTKMKKSKCMQQQRQQLPLDNVLYQGDENNRDLTDRWHKKLWHKISKDGQNVNKIARVAFPLLFIVFNVVYWSVLIAAYSKQ